METARNQEHAFRAARETVARIQAQVQTRIVGQTETVNAALAGLVLGGHVLLEGVPGVGKTLLAKSISEAVALRFSRIQFTPDLMPADIVGTTMIRLENGAPKLVVQPGPVFSQIVLADEINRASPKTQASLLEAMQERQVSLGGKTERLPDPFFVIATQNPLDNEGTYPLPEAQLDRFLLKLEVPFPIASEVKKIALATQSGSDTPLDAVASAQDLIAAGQTIRSILVADDVADYVVKLVFCTHPTHPDSGPKVRKYVRAGASPRAAQALLAVAKFFALLDGRYHVARADVQMCARMCLRHRVVLNFDAVADRVTANDLIEEALQKA